MPLFKFREAKQRESKGGASSRSDSVSVEDRLSVASITDETVLSGKIQLAQRILSFSEVEQRRQLGTDEGRNI